MKNYKSLVKKFTPKDKSRPHLMKPFVIDGKLYVTDGRLITTFNLTEKQLSEYGDNDKLSKEAKMWSKKWLNEDFIMTHSQKFYDSEIKKALDSAKLLEMEFSVLEINGFKTAISNIHMKLILDAIKSQKVDYVEMRLEEFRDIAGKKIRLTVGDDVRMYILSMKLDLSDEQQGKIHIAKPDTIAYDQIDFEMCKKNRKR